MTPRVNSLARQLLVIALFFSACNASYAEKTQLSPSTLFEKKSVKDRFSFAQMYLGYEYTNQQITIPTVNESFSQNINGNSLTFGGWHFWGNADFFITAPLTKESIKYKQEKHQFSPTFNTIFRWYPFTINLNKIMPFFGTGVGFFTYKGNDNAPKNYYPIYPLSLGFSYANRQFQLEFGVRNNYTNDYQYAVSTTQNKFLQLDDLTWFISLKRIVDTTVQLKKQKLIIQPPGFYPFIGIGLSTISMIDFENSYIKENTPYLNNNYTSNFLPELSFGTHFKYGQTKHNRAFWQIAWRKLNYSVSGYDTNYNLKYDSFAVEIAQTLFDYHGFVPYIGISYNTVHLQVSDQVEARKKQNVPGVLLGWDILPSGTNPKWALRTNIRWYPPINLVVDDARQQNISFPNFEFNIMQWIYQFDKF